LKVFENRVLRKIFGRRSERVRGGWRKWGVLRDEMGGACGT
jgi:hypothetical protein